MDVTKKLINAIRAKCLECSGGQRKEVKECPIKTCTLWPFRLSLDLLSDEEAGIDNNDEINETLKNKKKRKKKKPVKKAGRKLLEL
jgi:hypothetical protein